MTVPDRTICRNPATGEILGHSALNSIEVVGQASGRARQVQPAWSQRPVRERVRYLNRVRAYIAENADELAEIISRDNGKTRTDALASEVLPAAMAVDYYCRNAVAFLKDRRIRPGNLLMANKVSRIIRVPYGVVGIISPWNYPFSIPFSEVVMALLAGNAVLLKVATETQLVGRAIERCLAAAGLPEGLFAYLNLPGRIAGTALLEAGVDKLFFTGSVAVGQTLMAEAARTLTPVVLELGGNDPMLVCADADPERAAAGAVWAGLQNCGQSCGGRRKNLCAPRHSASVYGRTATPGGAAACGLRHGLSSGSGRHDHGQASAGGAAAGPTGLGQRRHHGGPIPGTGRHRGKFPARHGADRRHPRNGRHAAGNLRAGAGCHGGG
jgi:acyl-CoA reductase-like NAD-dependent aldehyde dehydrogenase